MRNLIIVVSIITIFSNANCQSESKKVLFIGNSLTSSNETPKLLAEMFERSNLNISVYQATKDGFSIFRHFQVITGEGNGEKAICKNFNRKDTVFVKLSKNEKWDFVILQDAVVPLLIPEERNVVVENHIRKLNDLINDLGGKVILFQPYTITNKYPIQYCYSATSAKGTYCDDGICCSDSLLNIEQEFEIILKATNQIAKKLDLKIAPIGLAFKKAQQQFPEILLFDDQDFHPSKFGAFLMASVYFQTITEKNPNILRYSGEIDKVSANNLFTVANQTFHK